MILKKILFSALFITTLIAFLLTGPLSAQGQETPFPIYGSGAIQVRIYTDYFCRPCRGMEQAVEPLLRDLIKRNLIRVTLVDTPFNKYSPLYARYFLYALKTRNDLEQTFEVRNVLFEAAREDVITKEGIETLFRNKGISYTAFEPKPAFDRFNDLIKEDIIHATPTCVIIKGGKKESFTGRGDIVKALRELK
jgi:protein-disulfide isomerase